MHRHPRGPGEGPGAGAGSWFDKGHPAEPAPAAETQLLPGPGPTTDSRLTADPAAAAQTQMLPGAAAAAETRVLPGTPDSAAPEGRVGGQGTQPLGPLGTGPTGTGPLRVQVEDPWETHDPHEVTVQLDAVSVRPGGTLGSAGPAGKEADRPVFVDESGRRSRRFRRLGMAIGLACAVYAVVIVVTLLSGNAAAPWVPVPVPGADDQPASKVKESPRQSESSSPSADTSAAPEAGTGPSAPVAPSAGVSPPAGSTVVPGAPAVPSGTPTASSRPTPSATSTKKAPDGPPAPVDTGGNGLPPDTKTPSTGPNPPDPKPSSSGSADPVDNGAATNNNAGGAATAHPVASTVPAAADRPGATPDHSPENVL
ncbi:hypothetical protein [Streptomyces sp. NPDC087317]|uniref:hypothetical protein n=1 Tax=Streptomyces sp. NPDC087317 TaxID=3365784 RepID=UPI0038246F24